MEMKRKGWERERWKKRGLREGGREGGRAGGREGVGATLYAHKENDDTHMLVTLSAN